MFKTHVSSSDIYSAGYNNSTMILEITFNSGATYQYSNVPASEYRALMAASSKGSYFHKNIKNNYSCVKI